MIDAHCDTAAYLLQGKHLRCLPQAQNDFCRIRQHLSVAFMAVFIDAAKEKACLPQKALHLLGKLLDEIEENEDIVTPLLCKEQLRQTDSRAKLLLAAEGGELLGENAHLLELWFRLGLRSLGLTWNHQNDLACGCRHSGGLTAAGVKTVGKCNQLGVMLDAAHLAEEGFWQLLEISQKPVIVSHAAAYSLRQHPRNLTDRQLKALAASGGVIGVTFVRDFLSDDGKAGLRHLMRHICHIAEVAGVDVLGIGSDFDGAEPLDGITGTESWPCLTDALAKEGFDRQEIAKITGGNFYRLIEENLPWAGY